MTPVRVIIVSPEEAADGNAELWLGPEMLAVTVLYDGRLHLRIDPRRDGEEKHEQVNLRIGNRHAELLDEIQRVVAREAHQVDVLRDHQRNEHSNG